MTPTPRQSALAKIPRVSLRPREAAQALGVSMGTLDAWSKAGYLPHVRRGAIVLYPVAALRRHLTDEAARQAADRAASKKGGADHVQ